MDGGLGWEETFSEAERLIAAHLERSAITEWADSVFHFATGKKKKKQKKNWNLI